MSKSRRSQRSAGRNTNNYEYKKEVSCKDNYLSDKHKEAREEFIKNNPIVPMNHKQRKYMELLEDKKCIIACGLAGTSKTYIPTATFADWYRTGKIDKIVLVRPAISNSKSLGFFAGSLETKASIWLAPILDVLHRRLGKAVTMLAIEKGDIEFVPLETVKGRSFGENVACIVTEAEDCTRDEIMSLLTRQNGCHMVIEGDILQSALKHTSGLKTAIDLLHKHPILQETMGYIEFNDFSDIVRSKECREWIKVFVKEGLM